MIELVSIIWPITAASPSPSADNGFAHHGSAEFWKMYDCTSVVQSIGADFKHIDDYLKQNFRLISNKYCSQYASGKRLDRARKLRRSDIAVL